ncbi:hypothetical protein D3C84_706490 [compost metagenome]
MLDDLQATAQLRAAGDEQLALQGHGRLDSRFVGVGQQFRGPLDLGIAQALGNQARLDAAIIEKFAQGHVQLRLRLHRIELHEQLPLGDAVAVADQQFFHHSADQRLHRLALPRHHHGATAYHPLVERRQAGPEQETAQRQDQESHAITRRAPGVSAGTGQRRRAAHAQPLLAVRLCPWSQITHRRPPP